MRDWFYRRLESYGRRLALEKMCGDRRIAKRLNRKIRRGKLSEMRAVGIAMGVLDENGNAL